MDKIGRNIDEEKRGKLLVLAAFISIAIFVTKITQAQAQIVVWRVYLNAAIYFLIAFVGLIWAFGFQIKKKSILFILLPSFYVFSQALFIEFFFFQKFSRIYEAIILLLLIFLAFLGNYVSFLMANVLNVDLFKKIPLAQVGRTSSYLVSLLMMYFFTFSFLVSGFQLYILLPLLLLSYIFVVSVHYSNIGLEGRELLRKSVLTILISFTLFLGIFLSGDAHEVVAAIPVLGYFFTVGVVSRERVVHSKAKGIYLYAIILVIMFLFAVFLNIRN